MNSKYYIPSKEEFYIGFECEKVIPHTDGGHQIDLTNIDQRSFIIRDVYDIPNDEASLFWFRVKYLDKEDIESLGFTNTDSRKINNIDLAIYNKRKDNSFYYSIVKDNLSNHIEIAMSEYNSGFKKVYFEGKLKNKSELKILLYQLNILQDEA